MSSTLQQKNTRYLLIWLPLILLIGSFIFFIMLTMHSHHMQEKQLALKQHDVWNAFKSQPASMPMKLLGEYEIKPGGTPPSVLGETRDTNINAGLKGENIQLKELTQQYESDGKTYFITTYVSSKEFLHLIIKVFITQVIIFLVLLAAIVVINIKSSKLLWRPFYKTMKETGNYNIAGNQSFVLEKQTGIKEFDQLNNELSGLIEKVSTAYSNQKYFVENASHEIQTPLAIIRSKLDLLINEPGLTERIAGLLGDITDANERLSQMNKSLLLLAKIDNDQFPGREPVCISGLINNILDNYQEHYPDHPLLHRTIAPEIYIAANPALMEILFSNLIKNSVVHNIPGGYINVSLSVNNFTIENSGDAIQGAPELLFGRFSKGGTGAGTGLGLALVRQISLLYKMELQYKYQGDVHAISLAFTNS